MSISLFQHHFLLALSKAGAQLKLKCQLENKDEGYLTRYTKAKSTREIRQNEFNINTQIPFMTQLLEQINQIQISEAPVDWNEYRKTLINRLDETRVNSEGEKFNKQKESGETISTDLANDFCNKTLMMFDEMRNDTYLAKEDGRLPVFHSHGDQPAENYTSKSYSASPFLKQLIHIALEYRFNKIQLKVSKGAPSYSPKHEEKWEALTETIELWSDIQTNPSPVFIRLGKRAITSFLTQLALEERNTQNEVKQSSENDISATAKSYLKMGLTLFTEEEDNLGPILQKFKLRYEPVSKFLVALPDSEELSRDSASHSSTA
tara:strand:+ start:92 stop:1051 length:960 start_codon:yes stop_codon:yes gene_type:complete